MKHYIKCDNCSNLVELHSQYMIFCPSCGAKMGNSFSAWKTANPDGSFEQYLTQFAVSGAAVEGRTEQRKISRSIKRRRTGKRLSIAVSIALVTFLLASVGFWLMRDIRKSSIDDILGSTWKLNYYEDLGTTIQFPHTLELISDTLIAQPDTIVGARHIVARSWKQDEVCNVTVMRVEFSDSLDVDREKATSVILQGIVGENSMEAFQYIPSDYELGTSKARMFSGSYLIATLLHEFRAVLILRNDELWYFMVAYPTSTPEGTILADKFFKTIQVNN